MCNPAAVGAVAAVMSTAVSVVSSVQSGKRANKIAEYNARVSENEATETKATATERENIHREKTQRLLSKQRAQLGSAGIELGSGSALQLQEDTLALGEADALRIRRQGGLSAKALNTAADLSRIKGENALTQGTVSAFGSIFSGTSKFMGTGVADKWFTPKSAAKIQ
jgi:hypothetical protein